MELIKELEEGKLSDAGWEQYWKYRDYYNDKYYFEYGGAIDFVAFIESDAKRGIERNSSK